MALQLRQLAHVKPILRSYQSKYLTLASDDSIELEDSQFGELNDVLQKNGIKGYEDLKWIKVQFPLFIGQEQLNKIKCHLNAFPVINRSLEEFTYSLKEYINLVPIKSNRPFFDIKNVSNNRGETYSACENSLGNAKKGTYKIKQSHIGKLDSQGAKEYVNFLLSLLKDESASFSFLNNDFLRKHLKEFDQMISLLEKKAAQSQNTEHFVKYLAITPFGPNEKLLIKYWSTDGGKANKIKSGSSMSSCKGVGIRKGTPILLTTTVGGQNERTFEELVQTNRRHLLVKDKIVTREDIKACCKDFFGNRIEGVEIQTGYTKTLHKKKGLVPCIEIELKPKLGKGARNHEEWHLISENLLFFLERNTVSALPFSIRTNEA